MAHNQVQHIMNFLSLSRNDRSVFLIAIISELALLASLLFFTNFFAPTSELFSSFPVFGPDSQEYYQSANNLLSHQTFSLSTSAPLKLDSFRPPVYPIFIAIVIWFFGSVGWVTVFQVLITGINAVLIKKIACKYMSEKASILVALLTTLEPSALYYGVLILSETLFTLFFLMSIYLFIISVFDLNKEGSKIILVAVLSGIFLGLAILTRAIAQFLPFVFLGLSVLTIWKHKTWREKGIALGGLLFGGNNYRWTLALEKSSPFQSLGRLVSWILQPLYLQCPHVLCL